MKRLSTLFLLISLVLSTSAFAATVDRSMSARVSPGDDVLVTFSISGLTSGELFTLRDTAPQGWRVDAWNVVGAQGDKEAVDYEFKAEDNKHGFSYIPKADTSQITFTVKVPSSASAGDYKFSAAYFDKSGFNNNDATVVVRTISCGDGVCEGSEDSNTCSQDCGAPSSASVPAAPQAEPAASEDKPEAESKEGGIAGTGLIVLVVIVVVGLAAFLLFSKAKKKGK